MSVHESLQEPIATVVGLSAINKPATLRLRLASIITDIFWLGSLFGAGVYVFNISPLPSWSATLFFLLMILIIWAIQAAFLGATLGQWIWKLKYSSLNTAPVLWKKLIQSKLIQTEHLSGQNFFSAIFLTVMSLGISFWTLNKTYLNHPLLSVASLEILSATQITPTESSNEKTEWVELPFFYTLGLWPKKFQGHPVLYQFPYEKGPPHLFPGHIVAHWDHPTIRLTMTGPHTHRHLTSLDFLKSCLMSRGFRSFACLKIRKNTLSKHIDEMKNLEPSEWRMRWFQIDVPGLSLQEKPEGIHLSASGEKSAQDRYLFIFGSGTEQAFILDRPLTADGDEATLIFVKSILSQRISSSLSNGKVLVNQQLAKTNLEELESLTQDTDRFLTKMSEIQALLLSKISVDPTAFEAYFHLGGTALLFAKQGMHSKNPEWSALAKPLVASALKYAEDISPNDPRTEQLRAMYKNFSVSK